MIRLGVAVVVAAGLMSLSVVTPRALGTGQSFLILEAGYQQELYSVVQLPADDDGFATVLGGVAFAPDGDVWAADCLFAGTTLHRFDAQSFLSESHGTKTLHPQVAVVQTQGGCGLTNHPDGFLYSNSMFGVVRLDVNTGLRAAWPDSTDDPRGPSGNALGITADPQTGHVIYVGADCHLTLVPGATTCTIYDLAPANGTVTTFALLDHADVPFVDGIYFDPTGTYLFMSNRGDTPGGHFLTVLRRPENSVPHTSDPQLVQSVLTGSEPDGVAFHAASPKFVITNDEEDGTMSKFEFEGDDYTAQPVQMVFARGGFRGDLLNVGADGCIYATQGRNLLPTDPATRYDNGAETTEDSIVRICAAGGGGFAPGPGVIETVQSGGEPICTGTIGDLIWHDLDRDGVQDMGEPGLADAILVLKDPGGAVLKTTVSSAIGFYQFSNLCAGDYTVEVSPPPGGYLPTATHAGADVNADSNSFPAFVRLSNNAADESIDFGVVLGTVLCPTGTNASSSPAGVLTTFINAAGELVVRYEQSRQLNDNSYGSYAVGWANGHTFRNLTGSDKAEIILRDATGAVVLDFLVDYISAKSGTPSGYGTLGVSGGDGKIISGNGAWILETSTSLATNLNSGGYCANGSCTINGVDLLASSPPADENFNVIDSVFSQWNFTSTYEARIDMAAFGAAGFGGVSLGEVHNSPAKNGPGAVTPGACPVGGGGGADTCRACKGGVTTLTLRYDGAHAHAAFVQVNSKDAVLFANRVQPGQAFPFTGWGPGGTMGPDITIRVDGSVNATIHTECGPGGGRGAAAGESIGPGLVRGDFTVIAGGSKDGGALCPLPPRRRAQRARGA